MTTQKQRVPALRFPGFSGEWEETTVQKFVDEGVFAKPMDGNHGNIHPVASDFVDDGIPFIMANDLKRGKLDFDRVKMISKEQADNLQKGFAKTGDVLLTHKATLGELAIISEIPWDYIMLTPQVTYYRVVDHQRYSNLFLFQYFATQKFQAELENKASGATRLYIGITEQRKLGIPVCSLPEQQKIASFLSSVDTKIEQLTKKKELLEKYKKGVMQKLFSQEIRFKDDEGNEYPDWEEKPISEVLTIGSGKDYKHLGSGDIPVYGTGGFMRYVDDFLYDGESVCIGRKGTIDKPMFLSGKFWTVDTLFYTHSFVNSLPKYFYYVFQGIDWKSYNEASGVPSLSKRTIDKIVIDVPHPDEQQKIADFLSALDTKIELVEKESEKAQSFKKGLLQKMFV